MKNIRNYKTLALAFIAAVTLYSCDSKKELAKNLEGTWSANPEKIMDSEALGATAVYMLQFIPQENTIDPLTGSFTLTAMLDINSMAPASDLVVQPYSISSSALASVEGAWTVVDDDEIRVNIDPASFKVEVDPKDVVLSDNILSGENTPAVDSITPVLAASVKAQIISALQNNFTGIKKIEDIHIKKDEMKCEIMDHDLHFIRN